MIPACLAIGGSDSCTGAGIQADLATFNSFGIKGCSAITALTAQTPATVARIEPAPLAQLEAEIRAAFDYYDIRAVKTGMLVDTPRIELIAGLLVELHAGRPLIVDPVMIASSDKRLLDADALQALQSKLFPLATLITPNIPEAAALLGDDSPPAGEAMARELADHASVPVLFKGGHEEGEMLCDWLCMAGDCIAFPHARRAWNEERSHGTGCRLASAIAAGLARGRALQDATGDAIAWLQGD